MLRTTRIRRQSKQGAAFQREWNGIVAECKAERGDRCDRCGRSGTESNPIDGHHKLPRRYQVNRKDLCVLLCRLFCHPWVEANKEAAHDAGFTMYGWEWDQRQAKGGAA
jgi:hypothetical protein